MISIAVKFCGGCNPRYERGDAYRKLCAQLADIANVSLAEPEVHYDVLVIFRGCTGCPYLYEEIPANLRLICLGENDLAEIIQKITALSHGKTGGDSHEESKNPQC